MTKKFVRTIGVILSISMVFSMMTACGKAEKTESSSSTTQGQTDEAAEKLDPVTLKFYFPGDAKPAMNDVWKAISEKTKDSLNAQFQINFVPFNDYVNKLQLLISSGDNYDMNFDGDWLAYPQMMNKGAYQDLSELFPKYAPKYYQKLKESKVIDSVTVEGKIMAVPWDLVTNDHPHLRMDFKLSGLPDLGFKPENNSIKTIEDMDALLAKTKELLPKKHIFEWDGVFNYSRILTILTLKYNYADIFDSFYGLTYKLDDPTCKLVPVEQTEMYKEALQWAKKWVDAEYIPRDLMLNRDAHTNEAEEIKVVGMQTNEYLYFNDTWKKPESWYSELYPESNYLKRSPLANLNAINVNAANPERTMMFLDMVSSDQSIYDLLLYGIEGQTYVQKDGAYIYPEGIKQETSNYMDWTGQWGFWRADLMRPSASRTAEAWTAIKDYSNKPNSVLSPLTGFFPVTDNVKNEVAKRTSLTTEYGKPLMYGIVKDIDKSLQEYIAKQKDAGTDKIVAEMQKQVDAFLASRK